MIGVDPHAAGVVPPAVPPVAVTPPVPPEPGFVRPPLPPVPPTELPPVPVWPPVADCPPVPGVEGVPGLLSTHPIIVIDIDIATNPTTTPRPTISRKKLDELRNGRDIPDLSRPPKMGAVMNVQ